MNFKIEEIGEEEYPYVGKIEDFGHTLLIFFIAPNTGFLLHSTENKPLTKIGERVSDNWMEDRATKVKVTLS